MTANSRRKLQHPTPGEHRRQHRGGGLVGAAGGRDGDGSERGARDHRPEPPPEVQSDHAGDREQGEQQLRLRRRRDDRHGRGGLDGEQACTPRARAARRRRTTRTAGCRGPPCPRTRPRRPRARATSATAGRRPWRAPRAPRASAAATRPWPTGRRCARGPTAEPHRSCLPDRTAHAVSSLALVVGLSSAPCLLMSSLRSLMAPPLASIVGFSTVARPWSPAPARRRRASRRARRRRPPWRLPVARRATGAGRRWRPRSTRCGPAGGAGGAPAAGTRPPPRAR